MKAYLNGEEIDYALGNALTEVGQYRIILTDAAGNISEYAFAIIYSVNAAGTVIIVLLILGVVGGTAAVFVLRRRKKFKTKSEPKTKSKTKTTPKTKADKN